MQVRRKFFLLVGVINKDLDPCLKKEAVKQAREERELAIEKGDHVTLYERTEEHGAVSVAF